MAELIEYTVADGEKLVMEVVEPEELVGITRAARKPGEYIVEASQRFEDAIASVRPAADAILAELRDLAKKPEEVEVEFGLKLTFKTGAVIASASTEGNFT